MPVAINKNLIIAIIFIVIVAVAGFVLRRTESENGNSATTFRKAGEIPLSELAALSGCQLPPIQSGTEANYDSLAKCLTDKGVKMYGAYWCNHCNNQKKMFGDSFKYINYIECADPNAAGQLEVCQKEKIDGYPTWEFPKKAN